MSILQTKSKQRYYISYTFDSNQGLLEKFPKKIDITGFVNENKYFLFMLYEELQQLLERELKE